ncbi:AAA family ATPase [Pseudonocardia sp. MCCB 268]|nr:AAA family ATPase [Pseudonocardia cytotoxica]
MRARAAVLPTPDQVRSERILLAATSPRRRQRRPSRPPTGSSSSCATKAWSSADQAAAVRGISHSGARVETLVGPAGTGKSFARHHGPRWLDRPRQPHPTTRRPEVAFGLATSQVATWTSWPAKV